MLNSKEVSLSNRNFMCHAYEVNAFEFIKKTTSGRPNDALVGYSAVFTLSVEYALPKGFSWPEMTVS